MEQEIITGSMMIKTKDVALNLSVDGEGDPIIFVHGYTTTANFWWHQIPDLAKYYRTVRFDLRGHGDSEKPENISYDRSEERRVGKKGGSTCRSGGGPDHK